MKTLFFAFFLSLPIWGDTPPHFFTAYVSDLTLHEVVPGGRDLFCTVSFISVVKAESDFVVGRKLADGTQIFFSVRLPITEPEFSALQAEAYDAAQKPGGLVKQKRTDGKNITIKADYAEGNPRWPKHHTFVLREPQADGSELENQSPAGKKLIEMVLRECAKDPRQPE